MTRAEHLKWCKERAIAELNGGKIADAWASMVSDMGKHPETQGHMAIELGHMLLMSGNWRTQAEVRKFIEDFN